MKNLIVVMALSLFTISATAFANDQLIEVDRYNVTVTGSTGERCDKQRNKAIDRYNLKEHDKCEEYYEATAITVAKRDGHTYRLGHVVGCDIEVVEYCKL